MSKEMLALETWLDEWRRIWPTESQVDRWLDDHYELPWAHDIRRDWGEGERRIWSIPDYTDGRTRCLGIDRSVLRDHDATAIIQALEAADWRNRIDREDLVVIEEATGALRVTVEVLPRSDKWFWSPDHDEWFVAFQGEAGGISVGESMPPPLRHFVAIHGRHSASVGPEGMRRIADLTFEEIAGHLLRRNG